MSNETRVIDDMEDLIQALFAKGQTITSITGLKHKGFESSKQTTELPDVGLKMSIRNIEPDRKRPMAGDPSRVMNGTGAETTYEVDGVEYTVQADQIVSYPMPVRITLALHTWSHSALTQAQLDLAVLQTFPERGVLSMTIGDDTEESDFQIELLVTQPLDDMQENYRERVYSYALDIYVPSSIADDTRKLILSQIFYFYTNSTDQEADTTGGPDFTVVIEPD